MKSEMSLRIGLIGAGRWGRNHLRTLKDLGWLAGVLEPDPRTRDQLGRDFPGLVFFDRIEELTPDTVDGVVIAAPAALHARLAGITLAAGLPTLVEKPLALDLTEARTLVELAEAKGLVLGVGHVLEYHPARAALQNLVDQGRLGRLLSLRMTRTNLGRIRTEENVLQSFAPHDISLALGLVGRVPEQVYGWGVASVTPGIHDTVGYRLDFGDGPLVQGTASWMEPMKEHRLVAVGERGMAVWDDTPGARGLRFFPVGLEGGISSPQLAHLGDPAGELIPTEGPAPLEAELRAFGSAIQGNSKLPTDGRQALQVLQVLDGVMKSLGSGRVEPLKQEQPKPYYVHPTAILGAGTPVGARTKIWHFCHVMGGSSIGENVSFGQNCFVAPGVTVGDGCRIQNNVSLYDGVVLEDQVFVGPSAVFTNVKHPRAHVERKNEYLETRVKTRASLGANSTVVCGSTIGEYAFVAAGAVVTRDVPAHGLMMGCPAVRKGWVCRCGEVLPEDLQCPRCGDAYREDQGTLLLLQP